MWCGSVSWRKVFRVVIEPVSELIVELATELVCCKSQTKTCTG